MAVFPPLVIAPLKEPPDHLIVLDTPFKVIAVQLPAVPVWVTITENCNLLLSKELSIGIPLTFNVISPDGFVVIPIFPEPVLYTKLTVFPLVCLFFHLQIEV